jgi:hypothetical protein
MPAENYYQERLREITQTGPNYQTCPLCKLPHNNIVGGISIVNVKPATNCSDAVVSLEICTECANQYGFEILAQARSLDGHAAR